MSDLGDELAFRYYLEHKYHDDFLKYTDPNTPQDVKNSIISRHATEFDIYKEIPYDVLLHWEGNPPKEIMEAASQGNYRKLQLDPFKIKEENDIFSTYNKFKPAETAVKATVVYNTFIDYGYSEAAALEISRESMFRDTLRDKALKKILTIDERE